uniref:Bap2(2) n=1 Tax=Schizophyllum commune TaxID=5334 RepID=Q9UVW3_SCHCO|nr:Bap2(2) [Schizophyllum commune]
MANRTPACGKQRFGPGHVQDNAAICDYQ